MSIGRGGVDASQLELTLVPARPALDAGALLVRLRALGLRGITSCTLTANRATVVSFRADRLRVHRAFTEAPEPVLAAIVAFVNGHGLARRRARRTLVAYEIPHADGPDTRPRRRAATHPDDTALAGRLAAAHADINRERFGDALGAVAIRVSRRLRRRLGHYSAGGRGLAPEIAIARRHVRRDGWASACETLAHEMVHQWQHETGRPLRHDREFRTKCIAIGIPPGAVRKD
jgi:SprT-like family